jgi:protein-disulfide isomerase
MDLPLESIHKNAFRAAEVANCAGEQGKYWEMHDQLFANQKTLDSWSAHAQAVGLDAAQFDACLASGKHAVEIRGDMTQAQRAGVTGTPGFFLAMTEPGSTRVKSLKFLRGAQPFAAFKAEIDRLLEAATKTPTGDPKN